MFETADLTSKELEILRERYAAAKAGFNMFFACCDIKQRSDVLNDIRHWLIEDKIPIDRHGFTFQFANGGTINVRVGHGGKGSPQ